MIQDSVAAILRASASAHGVAAQAIRVAGGCVLGVLIVEVVLTVAAISFPAQPRACFAVTAVVSIVPMVLIGVSALILSWREATHDLALRQRRVWLVLAWLFQVLLGVAIVSML